MKVLIFLLLFTTGGPAGRQAQPESAQQTAEKPSLAELARREKERRSTIEKKKPAITNADLHKFQSARVTLSGGPRPAASVAPAVPSESSSTESSQETSLPQTEAEKPKDMEDWKSAFAEARLNVTTAVNRGLVLQLKMNHLRNAFFTEDDGSTQALIQSQMDETLKELEKNRQEVEEAKKALEKLQQEARRAGVPQRLIDEMTGELPEAVEITSGNS